MRTSGQSYDLGVGQQKGSGRWGWVCLCTEPSPGSIWYCCVIPRFAGKPSQDPSPTPDSSLPIPHTAVCILHFLLIPLKSQPLPHYCLSFYSDTLSGEWESPQTPVSPSTPTGQWATSPLHAFFPWNPPLSPAACACGLHEQPGSWSPLPSHLCGYILVATWFTLHASTRLDRPPSDLRSCNFSPLSTGSMASHWSIHQSTAILTTLNGLAGSFPNISCLCFCLHSDCPSKCILLLISMPALHFPALTSLLLPATPSENKNKNLFHFSLWKILLT